MLTNHCYQNIPECWNEVTDNETKRKISECCGQPGPDDGSNGDCCYQSWDEQLKLVSQDYKSAVENSEQAKKKLVFITDRRDRYRTWVEELEKAEEKARLVCQQLDVLASQTRKIWYNSGKTVDAVQILFCMIRDFFFQVDGLRKEYDDLLNCVNNNHDQNIGKDTGILKVCDEYLKKLEDVIKVRDEMIKPAMEAIRIANLIRNNISTRAWPAPDKDNKPYDPCHPYDDLCPECCGDDERYYGLKAVVCEWYQEFNCNIDCLPSNLSEEERKKEVKRLETERMKAEEKKKECSKSQDPEPIKCECELEPTFYFPICTDWYKLEIERLLRKDEGLVDTLRKELTDIIKKKESLQACKDSLTKAVKEVDPKDRCK
ncbi:MAG: hypothetical protein ABIT05_14865 [Chitinophagaceae bacterium]